MLMQGFMTKWQMGSSFAPPTWHCELFAWWLFGPLRTPRACSLGQPLSVHWGSLGGGDFCAVWQYIAGGFMPDLTMFRMDPDVVMAGLEIAYCYWICWGRAAEAWAWWSPPVIILDVPQCGRGHSHGGRIMQVELYNYIATRRCSKVRFLRTKP